MIIQKNIVFIKNEIARVAAKNIRSAQDITLICVSKNRSVEEICEVLDCGINHVGENRVQEAKLKFSFLKEYASKKGMPITFHMVGHLQSNKVKEAISIFDLIHSLDSLRLAEEIDKEACKINKVQDVLIQVNTSGEESKFGITPQEVLGLVEKIKGFKNVKIKGLMTIAPFIKDTEKVRSYFKMLKEIRGNINEILLTTHYSLLSTLSMGMSQDYQVAIEEGANMLRIGSAIFENRE